MFVLSTQFVLVNVVVAVLMKHLEDSKEIENSVSNDMKSNCSSTDIQRRVSESMNYDNNEDFTDASVDLEKSKPDENQNQDQDYLQQSTLVYSVNRSDESVYSPVKNKKTNGDEKRDSLCLRRSSAALGSLSSLKKQSTEITDDEMYGIDNMGLATSPAVNPNEQERYQLSDDKAHKTVKATSSSSDNESYLLDKDIPKTAPISIHQNITEINKNPSPSSSILPDNKSRLNGITEVDNPSSSSSTVPDDKSRLNDNECSSPSIFPTSGSKITHVSPCISKDSLTLVDIEDRRTLNQEETKPESLTLSRPTSAICKLRSSKSSSKSIPSINSSGHFTNINKEKHSSQPNSPRSRRSRLKFSKLLSFSSGTLDISKPDQEKSHKASSMHCLSPRKSKVSPLPSPTKVNAEQNPSFGLPLEGMSSSEIGQNENATPLTGLNNESDANNPDLVSSNV